MLNLREQSSGQWLGKRLFFKPVAGPGNSDEMDRLGRLVFDLLPQVVDKGIHGPRGGEFVIAPDFIED